MEAPTDPLEVSDCFGCPLKCCLIDRNGLSWCRLCMSVCRLTIMGLFSCSSRFHQSDLCCLRVGENLRNIFGYSMLRKETFLAGFFFPLSISICHFSLLLYKGYKVVHFSDQTASLSSIRTSWGQEYKQLLDL